jgi:hypothetical protein
MGASWNLKTPSSYGIALLVDPIEEKGIFAPFDRGPTLERSEKSGGCWEGKRRFFPPHMVVFTALLK